MKNLPEIDPEGILAISDLMTAVETLKRLYPQIEAPCEHFIELLIEHFPVDDAGVTHVNPCPRITFTVAHLRDTVQ